MVKAAFTTFLDQIVVSGTSFIIGLAFIYLATPAEYGLYTILFSIYYLVSSAQNALINTPLAVLSQHYDDDEKVHFEKGLFGLWAIGVVIITLAMFSAAPLFAQFNSIFIGRRLSVMILAVCLAPLSLRDFWRAEEFAVFKPQLALKRDLGLSAISLSGLIFLVRFAYIKVEYLIPLSATAALAVVCVPTLEFLRARPAWTDIVNAFNRSWSHSSWSLMGAVSSWLQSNAYIYIPFMLLGVKKVAFLAAARLIMMPAALLAQSWSNYFRPLVSRQIANNNAHGAKRAFIDSTVVLLGIVCIYAALVVIAFKLFPASWLPSSYRGISAYISLWAAVIAVQVVRSNASSLLQASLNFKSLAIRGFISAALTAISTFVFVRWMAELGAIVAQISGEFILMLLLLHGFYGLAATRPIIPANEITGDEMIKI